jgi:hypothetical protein
VNASSLGCRLARSRTTAGILAPIIAYDTFLFGSVPTPSSAFAN